MYRLIRKILNEEVKKSKIQKWVDFLLGGYLFDNLIKINGKDRMTFSTAFEFLDTYLFDTIFDVIYEDQMPLIGYIKNENGEWYNPVTDVHEDDDNFMLSLTYDYIYWLVEKGELSEYSGGWVATYPDFYIGYGTTRSNTGFYRRNIFEQKYENSSIITKYDITRWYDRGFKDITTLSLNNTIKVFRMFEKTVVSEVENRIKTDRKGFMEKYGVKLL